MAPKYHKIFSQQERQNEHDPKVRGKKSGFLINLETKIGISIPPSA